MNILKSEEVKSALRYWAASYVLVAGFLFYHAGVNFVSLALGGLVTLGVTVAAALSRTKKR